jgi:hypothetical protein
MIDFKLVTIQFKNMINIIRVSFRFLIIVLLISAVACNGDNEEGVDPPKPENAIFSYSFDQDNPNKVFFIGEPDIPTWFTHFSFGDNTGAEGPETTKIYFEKGEYEVKFKIFTEGGTASSTQLISIEQDFAGPNQVQNGEMDGDEHWTVLPISDGVEVAFEDGTAVWSGGGWGHVGIYQQITIEPGEVYQVDMDVSGGGLADAWFEVYVGQVIPQPGVDYTDGGMLMGLNTWNGCGTEPFEGPLTALSCNGGDGTFEYADKTSAYLVIRAGGGQFDPDGVTLDNVTVRPVD